MPWVNNKVDLKQEVIFEKIKIFQFMDKDEK